MKNIYLTVLFLLFLKSSTLAQWTNILTNYKLYSSCFATSPDTCFVTATNGLIFRTTNGGMTWDSAQTLFNTSWYNDIYFPSANVGYACGGTAFGTHTCVIAKTIDGGQTWDSLLSNGGTYEFYKIFFVNDSVGYCGGDYFVKTTDGGQTFTTVTIPFTGRLGTIHFINDSVGFISTYEYAGATKEIYRIAKTTDGGLNWTTNYIDSVNPTVTNHRTINEIYFTNSMNGFSVCNNGYYLKTIDGGLNWSSNQLFQDSTNLTDIVISKASGIGYMTSRKYSAATGYESNIYKTIDTGYSWQINHSDSLEGFYSVSMASNDVVYAAGFATIFKTINGGATIITENNLSKNNITFFPNPFTDRVSINILDRKNENILIQLFDQTGKKVYQTNSNPGYGKIEIEFPKLFAGIYFLVVTGTEFKTAAKLVRLN